MECGIYLNPFRKLVAMKTAYQMEHDMDGNLTLSHFLKVEKSDIEKVGEKSTSPRFPKG